MSIEERLDNLERRITSIEAVLYKRGGIGAATRKIVAKWPGPFTAKQITEAVYELHPNLKPVEEMHQIANIIHKMERQRLVTRIFQGAGPTPNIYEYNANPPAGAGKLGTKMNSHHQYESGFRGIVRLALDDLPEEWRIGDLRKWVAEKAPAAKVPYGSWSSTLYKMTQQGELVVVRGGRRTDGSGLKVYKRGPRRITPTGDELRELESAWQEFRKSMKIEAPTIADFETMLGRGEE